MATYPLKVKDGAGNVHTVGDPRIGAAAGDIPQASVNGLVSGLAAKAPLASPALTGTPTAPTAATGTDTTQVATTEFVNAEITNDRPYEATAANIKVNGTQAVGTASTVARGDHVHPTDTSRAPLTLTQNARTDSYTLVLSDAGKLIEMGKATAQTLTIPLNSSVAFPVGTKIDVVQTGAGETSIAGTAGVTVNSEGGKLKINAQWQAVTLVKRATDTWVVIGALKA